jgi:hypothetical protein
MELEYRQRLGDNQSPGPSSTPAVNIALENNPSNDYALFTKGQFSGRRVRCELVEVQGARIGVKVCAQFGSTTWLNGWTRHSITDQYVLASYLLMGLTHGLCIGS